MTVEVPSPSSQAFSVADLLVDPAMLLGADQSWRPLAFIDLEACPPDAAIPASTPFPVIGLGDPRLPLAARVDAVVEPPISADALLRQVLLAPRAAAAAMHLLRSTDGLEPEAALLCESICYGLLQGGAEHAAWLKHRTPPSPSVAPGAVIVERRGAVLDVTLDRPAARNAIDRTLRDGLHEAFTLAALDPDLHSLRLRAAGRTFSVGADLGEFGVTRDPPTAHLIRMRTLPALALTRCAGKLEAHVQGGCVGAGLEIAAFARRLTASPDAWFQLPELAMGLIPGAGGCVSLPRRIGRGRAALMILSGRRINAATALRWGLIDEIVDAPAAGEDGAHER